MDITGFLSNHMHYWGIPHSRSVDGHIVQTCYECGAESEVKIKLRPSPFLDPLAEEQETVKAAERCTSFVQTEVAVHTFWAKVLTMLQSMIFDGTGG